MLLIEKEINFPKYKGKDSLLGYFGQKVQELIHDGDIPVRFVITRSDDSGYKCELGVLSDYSSFSLPSSSSIFNWVFSMSCT